MRMVEKVARRLEPQAWAALGTGDTLAYKNRRTSSLRKARAVLNEIREPDDEMAKAGIAAWEKSPMAVVMQFRAMIDKAIQESGE